MTSSDTRSLKSFLRRSLVFGSFWFLVVFAGIGLLSDVRVLRIGGAVALLGIVIALLNEPRRAWKRKLRAEHITARVAGQAAQSAVAREVMSVPNTILPALFDERLYTAAIRRNDTLQL